MPINGNYHDKTNRNKTFLKKIQSFPNFNLIFVHIYKKNICLDSILQPSSSEISPTQETGMIYFTGTSFTTVISKAIQKIDCWHDLFSYITQRS